MPAYRFRPFTRADLPLMRLWRSRPHVIEWWGAPEVEDAEATLADPGTAMWIVEHAGRPFAYAQDYDPHAWPAHPFAHLPPGSRGIDQTIGEPDMLDQGHGSAFVRQRCDHLFAAGGALGSLRALRLRRACRGRLVPRHGRPNERL